MSASDKLKEAIREYIRESGEEMGQNLVSIDYALTVSATSWDAPGEATFYFTEHSGALHSMMGLTKIQEEHFLALNREEAELDN